MSDIKRIFVVIEDEYGIEHEYKPTDDERFTEDLLRFMEEHDAVVIHENAKS